MSFDKKVFFKYARIPEKIRRHSRSENILFHFWNEFIFSLKKLIKNLRKKSVDYIISIIFRIIPKPFIFWVIFGYSLVFLLVIFMTR